MARYALEILGLVLGMIGVFGCFAVTLMPQWKVTARTEGDLISVIQWKGLWMDCISQINSVRVCINHKSVLALEMSLGVSRGLMCTACALSVIAFLIAISGLKIFRCLGDNQQIKNKMLLAAGVIFFLTGVIVMISVSWVANTIIKDFYNPAILVSRKHELGEALYLGWAASAFLISGGSILCSFCQCAKNPRGFLSSSSHRMIKPEHVKGKSASVHSYI